MLICIEPDLTGYVPRNQRWSAVDEDRYDGAPDSPTRNQVGYGATPVEALADLLTKIEDRTEGTPSE